MNTDPIADMLTRIRNAAARRQVVVSLPHSRLKQEIGQILVKTGYLSSSERVTDEAGHSKLELTLKYRGSIPTVEGIKRISKPGQRIYEPAGKLNKLSRTHTGDIIISTTSGLLTDREAKKAGLGGEILFRIW